ncbi:helix-turn-helix domain-containing protein [Actinomadura rugatobispora]|uniref:Helix-turn-helix domain-containing protein n=1 Tax=Actinomadura rugatobispora TaxID=1994 RepID=A0ABW1AH89_9ACTN|nr:hypothetical protein GCM10010200_109650 [Actinomadura rugatobispora]
MKELAGRLEALDPDAGAALQVIAYYDRLVEGRAGLEALVRGAAVLTGRPARLVDETRRVRIRVDPGGRRADGAGPPPAGAGWPSAPLEAGGPPALWLEGPGPAGVVEAMVLERASTAIRAVLERTRGKVPAAGHDQAMVETVLDPAAPAVARLRAARRLGLDPRGRARALAMAGGVPAIEPVPGTAGSTGGRAAAPDGTRRTGIGPEVPVLDLPVSHREALTALRLTAEGTERDPGPRVVHADRLGGLAVLAAAVGPDTEPVPDVRALERAAASAPWMLAVLDAVASARSLRGAAEEMAIHHSTLQDRLAHAESLLGWSVHEPQGRLRLQLALALRRLHRNTS